MLGLDCAQPPLKRQSSFLGQRIVPSVSREATIPLASSTTPTGSEAPTDKHATAKGVKKSTSSAAATAKPNGLQRLVSTNTAPAPSSMAGLMRGSGGAKPTFSKGFVFKRSTDSRDGFEVCLLFALQ
jgi:hypothetical protein